MSELTDGLKIILPLATYRKIMAYATICDLEISGFCEVEYNEARSAFIAGEPYLLRQEVTGGSTHMDEEAVSAFNLERIKAGATQLPRLWWHSHVNMEAFFSAIDEGTLKDLQNDSFIIALVVNKRKNMKAKAYVYSQTATNLLGFQFEEKLQTEIDPLPIQIEFEYERIPESLKKEVEEKVKTKTFTPQLPSGDCYGGRGKKREHGHASIIKPLFLPKDRTAANKRIEEKGLEKEWDHIRGEYIYKDLATGEIWVDFWATLDEFDAREDPEWAKRGHN